MGKVEDLNKIKTKLEVTLDELEDSYEREKKARLEMDKQRRKAESELTVTQEEVADLERDRNADQQEGSGHSSFPKKAGGRAVNNSQAAKDLERVAKQGRDQRGGTRS